VQWDTATYMAPSSLKRGKSTRYKTINFRHEINDNGIWQTYALKTKCN